MARGGRRDAGESKDVVATEACNRRTSVASAATDHRPSSAIERSWGKRGEGRDEAAARTTQRTSAWSSLPLVRPPSAFSFREREKKEKRKKIKEKQQKKAIIIIVLATSEPRCPLPISFPCFSTSSEIVCSSLLDPSFRRRDRMKRDPRDLDEPSIIFDSIARTDLRLHG